MFESLEDLQEQILGHGGHLFFYNDSPINAFDKIKHEYSIDAVYVNRDYTPFSIHRDNVLEQKCRDLNLDFLSYSDLLLTEPEQVLKDDNKPYKVFTPFYNRARQEAVELPQPLHSGQFINPGNTTILSRF